MRIKDDHKSEHNPTGRVLAGPQIIQVPFECEESVHFVVDYHRNRSMDRSIPNHRQFLAVLTVDLISIVKPTEDAQGGVRIVDSEDGGEEEQGMDEEQVGEDEY